MGVAVVGSVRAEGAAFVQAEAGIEAVPTGRLLQAMGRPAVQPLILSGTVVDSHRGPAIAIHGRATASRVEIRGTVIPIQRGQASRMGSGIPLVGVRRVPGDPQATRAIFKYLAGTAEQDRLERSVAFRGRAETFGERPCGKQRGFQIAIALYPPQFG